MTEHQDKSASHEPPDAKGPKYFVDIEGSDKPWDHETITVPQIRVLAGWAPTDQVVEVNLETNEERVLDEDAVITLKPGHGFGKKIKFQRGLLERWQEEEALLLDAYPRLERLDQDGQRWCRIPEFAVDGSAFTPNPLEVAFRIPTQAGEMPYGFWVRPAVALIGGGTTSNYTVPATTPWGADWAQFSWSPLSWVPKENIRAGANMLAFVRSIADRLRER